MAQHITAASTVVAAQDQLSCDVDGEAAILNLASGVYYGLDPIGASIWNQLQKPISVAAIRDSLTSTYQVDDSVAEADLIALLTDMMNEGLITLAEEQR